MTGMLRIIACAAAAALGAILLAAVPTNATDALTARVQAAYDAQCNDVLRDDFTSLQNTFSPTFTASQDGRTITRDDVITNLKAFASRGTITKCSTSVQSVQEDSNVVIAMVTQRLGGTVMGGKSSVPIEIDAGRRDMWTDQGKDLQETTFNSIWSEIYVNGRLAQQAGTPPSGESQHSSGSQSDPAQPAAPPLPPAPQSTP
jgi:hypothetical protein